QRLAGEGRRVAGEPCAADAVGLARVAGVAREGLARPVRVAAIEKERGVAVERRAGLSAPRERRALLRRAIARQKRVGIARARVARLARAGVAQARLRLRIAPHSERVAALGAVVGAARALRERLARSADGAILASRIGRRRGDRAREAGLALEFH